MTQQPRAFLNVQRLEDRTNPSQDFVPGEVIVGFPEGAEGQGLISVSERMVVVDAKRLGFGMYKLTLQPGVSVDTALAQLNGRPGVSFVSPNFRYQKTSLPNDPNLRDGTQWHHQNLGQSGGTARADLGSSLGWDVGVGTGQTVVAVIDDAIEYTHPDLAGNMWFNPGEVAGDGLDNDGNGFVDDIHGYDFTYDTGNMLGGIIDSHGSHVAGILGAVGNNGLGVSGVVQKTRMMSLPIFSSAPSSGTTAVIVQAINYSVLMGAKISNNSWGATGLPGAIAGTAGNVAILRAIQGAERAGQIFVTAAGNDGVDNDIFDSYPSDFYNNTTNVISVAAFDRNDQLADFSQYGRESVTLGAPGVEIQSTLRGQQYGLLDGTSMASPMVAGALAAFWDAYPELNYLQVIDALKRTVRKIPAAADKTDTGGVLDFAALMAEARKPIYATGAGETGAPHVKVYRGQGVEIASFMAFDQRFTGGVRVATGDVNGDGAPDIITVAGAGGGPHVKVFNGRNFQEMFSFFAFEQTFSGGLTVAAGDVNGDGRADIVVGADSGGGPRVSVFSQLRGTAGLARVADFYAYDPRFTGGVRVATGVFVSGGGPADIVVTPGRGGGPHLRRFNGASVLLGRPTVVAETFVGSPDDTNGLWVTAADYNLDGVADIITGSGAFSNIVTMMDGRDLGVMRQFVSPFSGERPGSVNPAVGQVGSGTTPVLANGLIQPGRNPNESPFQGSQTKPLTSAGYIYGVRVASKDLNRDNTPDLIITGGPNDSPTVALIDGRTFQPLLSHAAYDPIFAGGVYVGSGV